MSVEGSSNTSLIAASVLALCLAVATVLLGCSVKSGCSCDGSLAGEISPDATILVDGGMSTPTDPVCMLHD